MKYLLGVVSLILLVACGSGGPPQPDWRADSADLIERYKKHALLGENVLAERYFQQAVAATGGTGRVADTARLWLVRCATRRAMLIDDRCDEYAELARIEPRAPDRAYYQFLQLQWDAVDTAQLPSQHRDLVRAAEARKFETTKAVNDPLARLLQASLLVLKGQSTPELLVLATDTASAQGWRQPLLTYLKLRAGQALAAGDVAEQARLAKRIELVEKSLSNPL